MKKKLLSILLLLSSCASTQKNDVIIHDIDVDFPTADTVAMKYRQTFDAASYSTEIAVKDTIFFTMNPSSDNIGYCYNINSGKMITQIINRGRAANEIISDQYSLTIAVHRDNIQFIDPNLHEIKSISMDDILTKSIGERVLTKTHIPEPIKISKSKIIDNNILIGQNDKNENGLRYFILDGKELSLFGKYNDEIFKSTVNQKITMDIMSNLYEPIFTNDGSKIVVADKNGIILELIDVNKKSVVKSRFYTKLIINEFFDGCGSRARMTMCTLNVHCTDKEIYCIVAKDDKVKSKKEKEFYADISILVFDWELNPVKKYHIGSFINHKYRFCMTEDCKKFYYLTEENETQILFEGIIN